MKNLMLILFIIMVIFINENIFAVTVNQNFNIRLQVAEPLLVEVGSLNKVDDGELEQLKINEFLIRGMKNTVVEISLEVRNEKLEDNNNEVKIHKYLKVNEKGITKLGAPKDIKGSVDFKLEGEKSRDTFLKDEYLETVSINVNYN